MSKGAVITKSLGTPALANPYVVTNSWYYQLGILQATSKGTKMTGNFLNLVPYTSSQKFGVTPWKTCKSFMVISLRIYIRFQIF